MLERLKNRKDSGFSIVEVMIVLAIAGLIMAVVFMAVPALQRNQRTSARKSDAQLILAAVNECLSNKNGQITSCDSNTEVDAFLDRSKLSQLDEASTAAEITTAGQTTARTAAGAAIDNTWRVSYNTQCNSDGSGASVVTNKRQYAIMYGVENNSGSTVVVCMQG